MQRSLYVRWQWRSLVRRCLGLLAVFVLALPLSAGSAIATSIFDIPTVQAGSPPWVIDQGDVLSVLSQGALNKKLGALADKTGTEVRFVTIRRYDYGETATTFTKGLFERWFPTPDAQANQVLVLLDTQTNTTDIRTGAAVKATLADEVATSIVSETMLVPIRNGNYNQGLLDAANRLALVLSGEPDPGPPEIREVDVESTFTKAEETDDRSASILVIVLLLAATIIPMATYYWYQRD